MDKPIEFRRRGRGYDKNDVNEFISKENIRFNKLEQEYNKTIRDLEREIDKLNMQINESEDDKAQIVKLEISIAELKEKINDLKTSISEKDTIIDGLKSAVDNANKKLDLANSMIEELRNRPEVPCSAYSSDMAYDDSVVEKARQYDAICDNVDEIFAVAKEEADKIIAEALEIRKQALKRSPASVRSDLSGKSKSIIDELRSNIRRQLKK
ncbi:MAG: hypothetical protein IKU19_01935 [Clostridia bacterium]|nr:hypothetical protein [Clostridia bacterium]